MHLNDQNAISIHGNNGSCVISNHSIMLSTVSIQSAEKIVFLKVNRDWHVAISFAKDHLETNNYWRKKKMKINFS